MDLLSARKKAKAEKKLIRRMTWDPWMKISPNAEYLLVTLADACATNWSVVQMDPDTGQGRAGKDEEEHKVESEIKRRSVFHRQGAW